MKRFQFKLQPVLKYRQYQEQLASRNTARAQLDVTQSAMRIDQFKQEQTKSAEELDRVSRTSITSQVFKQYRDYQDFMEYEIQRETVNKKKLEQILVEQRQILKKKSIEKKVMERLRQKKEDAYMDEFRKAEQGIMDETASLKKARERVNEINR